MYTCKKATELIEREQSETFSWWTKIRLKMHLMMCGSCFAYKKQSQILSNWIKNKKALNVDETELSTDSKKELIKNIKKKYAEL